MKSTPKLLALAATLGLITISLASPVKAEDSKAMEVFETLTSATLIPNSPAETLLDDLQSSAPTVGEPPVRVPNRSSQSVVMTTRNNELISIGLPFGKLNSDGQVVAGRSISFDNKNGSTTVLLPKTDGSVQVATIIDGVSAPTSFSYPLSLPAGGRALVSSSGLVLILDSQGQYAAAVAPPWAIDAKGVKVPTRFELRGNWLVQSVDHLINKVTYPVVADPWFGVDMIDRTSWNRTSEFSPTLSVYPSAWGRAVALATTYPLSSGFLGVADQLSSTAAWSEALSKTARASYPNPGTPTMRAQFDCHFFWVSKRHPRKVSWNLDTLRPYASMVLLAQKNCNVE